MFIETKMIGRKRHYWLVCDGCNTDIVRSTDDFDIKRANNNFKHFCSDCGTSAIGKHGRNSRVSKPKRPSIITKHGYIEVYVGQNTYYSGVRKDGYIRGHVKTMQDYLGRSLRKGEVIHHIDGDKTNNDIANLDLCTVKEHNNVHAKIESVVFELVKRGVVKYDRVTKRYLLS